MITTDGSQLIKVVTPDELIRMADKTVTFSACVHKIKKSFVMLRTGRYVFQGLYNAKICENDINELCEGAYITVTGTVKAEPRVDFGFEIQISSFEVLSKPEEEYPLPVSNKSLECDVETTLEHRTTALRHLYLRAVFKIREGITNAFREFMLSNDFTEIHTPKIVSADTEGTNNAFATDYFGSKAYLAQSNELYKQTAIAFFDRVFEVTPVFTAQKRSSMRHLNEYTYLTFEMSFLKDMRDVMAMQTAILRYTIDYLARNYHYELDLLDCTLPVIKDIPIVSFREALDILGKTQTQIDLDPTDTVKLCQYIKENSGSEFVFVEKFPALKRSFYITGTENFDLLTGGLEIASGGQHIHSYKEQLQKITEYGLNTHDYEFFLDVHKHGMPPHGGLSLNIERFMMKLLNLQNIRETTLFPRDMRHLKP